MISVNRLSEYYRDSLEQAAMSTIRPVSKNSMQISLKEMKDGQLEEFDLKKEKNFFINDEEEASVLLCPIQWQRGYNKNINYIYPLIVPALLNREGQLTHESYSLPWIPRELLEPTSSDQTIGDLEELLMFFKENDFQELEWDEYIALVNDMFLSVTGEKVEKIECIGKYEHVLKNVLLIKDSSSGGMAANIVKLYDDIIETKEPLKLLSNIVKDSEIIENLLPENQLHEQDKRHLGQMKPTFGLSPSQREVIRHVNALNDRELIGVTGPPGTGKTTLLQSIIASEWIHAALLEERPPICVVSSTNNQAVTNVIDSFQMEVKDKTLFNMKKVPRLKEFNQLSEDFGLLEKRWIPDLDSYGLYLVSKAKYKDQIMRAKISIDNRTYINKQETEDFLEEAKSDFLEKYNQLFSKVSTIQLAKKQLHCLITEISKDLSCLIELNHWHSDFDFNVIESLNDNILIGEDKIRKVTAEMDNDKKILLEWQEFETKNQTMLDAVPWLTEKRKKDREQIFCQLNDLDSLSELQARNSKMRQSLENLRRKISFAKKEVVKIKKNKETYTELIAKYHIDLSTSEEQTLPSFDDQLDMTVRYLLFVLTTHYWEARWLLEIQELYKEDVLGKNPESLEAYKKDLERYAMLTPCFVGTLYQLPVFFKLGKKPMFEVIDLLITDESGQVSPEICTASLALAKKYIAVGDTKQIEPIWNILKDVDKGNLLQSNMVSNEKELEKFFMSGRSVSTGNLMEIAQKRSKFTKYKAIGGGLFLSEHRRCLPEIIQYSNQLAYDGKLEAKRQEKTEYYEDKLPPMGYGHISGKMKRDGGSWSNEMEAKAIAKWIKSEEKNLLERYEKKSIGEVVAVVTPFSAQRNAIKHHLKHLGYSEKEIVVGTVHALQGAEKSVVIFSTVYDSYYKGNYFFDKSVHMLNVAVSRAKDSFLVFGDTGIFKVMGNSPSSLLAKILFASEENAIAGLEKLCADNFSGKKLSGAEEHHKFLENCIKGVRKELHIVSPYLSEFTIRNFCKNTCQLMSQKVQSGVKINIYTTPAMNESRKASYENGKKLLKATGVNLIEMSHVHSKMLVVDDRGMVDGSFNWFSASRDKSYKFYNWDTSLIYFGDNIVNMIEERMKALEERIL